VRGLTTAKQVGGGEETPASRGRGHWWGLSGWGGSTRWRGAWGGVEMVGEGLERVVCGGSVRPERNGGGGAAEGAGKVVRGALGGAELRAVMGGLEGDRVVSCGSLTTMA
jgi:hypothetical protein